MSEFKIWQTLTLGKLGDYCRAIDKFPCHNFAKELLKHPYFSRVISVREIDLVIIRASSLGYKKWHEPTIKQVYRGARSLGLRLCPPEVGPELFIHLQSVHQDSDCRPLIAMKPLILNGTECAFFMDKNTWHGHKTLGFFTELENPRLVWEDYYQFVFELPRKK